MRFSVAWADIAKQNNVLRFVAVGVTSISFVILIICLKFVFREPLVLERGCYTTVASTSSVMQTQQEIEGFVREALSERYNSDAVVIGDYFSLEELKGRENEQTELKRREIKQKIIVNSITKSGPNLIVDADRVFSVGLIRSAFQFPLNVSIANTTRSTANPYGLVITKAVPITKEEKKDAGK